MKARALKYANIAMNHCIPTAKRLRKPDDYAVKETIKLAEKSMIYARYANDPFWEKYSDEYCRYAIELAITASEAACNASINRDECLADANRRFVE